MMFRLFMGLFLLLTIASCNSNSSSGNNNVKPSEQNIEPGRLVGTWLSCTSFDNGGSDLDIYNFHDDGNLEVEIQNYDNDNFCEGEFQGSESMIAKYQVTATSKDTLQVAFFDITMTPEPTDIRTIAANLAITFENNNDEAEGTTTFLRWQDPEGNTGELSQDELDMIPVLYFFRVTN